MSTEGSFQGSASGRQPIAETLPYYRDYVRNVFEHERYVDFIQMLDYRHQAYAGNIIFNHRPVMPTHDELAGLSPFERVSLYDERDEDSRFADAAAKASIEADLCAAGGSAMERFKVLLAHDRAKSIDIIELVDFASQPEVSIDDARVAACQLLHESKSCASCVKNSSSVSRVSICVDDSIVPQGEVIVTANRELARIPHAQQVDLDGDGQEWYDIVVAERVSYAFSICDIQDYFVSDYLASMSDQDGVRRGFVYNDEEGEPVLDYFTKAIGFQHVGLRPIAGNFYAFRHVSDSQNPELGQVMPAAERPAA